MADHQMEVPLVANFSGNPRVQWTPSLHQRFLTAVTELGGPYEAKPKAILERMGVQGLTLRHIKSHLQKYRASFNAARGINFMNGEQTVNESPAAPIGDNAFFPHTEMGVNGIYEVPGIHTGTGGIPYMASVPNYNIGAHVSQIQTRTEDISSMPPIPYDIGGPEAYDLPQFPVATEEIPHMLPDPYDTRSQNAYVPTQAPIGTETNHYLKPAFHTIGSQELYGTSGFQIGPEGILEPHETYFIILASLPLGWMYYNALLGCTNRFTDSWCINDTANQLRASSTVMDYSTSPLLSPAWEPTPYAMMNQEVNNQTTTLLGIEGEAATTSEEYHYYRGNLGSGNDEKGKGTMGLHPQNVVAHHLEFPTNSMPSYNMLPTPSDMEGYEFHDGLGRQREMEESMQQARLTSKK